MLNRRSTRISTGASGRSGGCSCKSRRKLSHCLHKRRNGIEKEEPAMKQQGKTTVGRRDFLRAMATGAGVAAVSAGPLASTAAADSENNDEKRKARYKETDHVKTFYRASRCPTT